MRKEGVPQSDDAQYRDYLLSVLDLSVTKPPMMPTDVEFNPPPSAQDVRNKTLENLERKFKQDFATGDNSVIGANAVAVEVLKAALAEDLGFAAADIPAQGT